MWRFSLRFPVKIKHFQLKKLFLEIWRFSLRFPVKKIKINKSFEVFCEKSVKDFKNQFLGLQIAA